MTGIVELPQDDASPNRTGDRKKQVRRFYEVLWDARDLDAMPSILHADFAFRGSLGDQERGHREFADYVEMVHAALGDYRCTVEELVEEGDKVFARMSFGGVHRKPFRGYEPTGRIVRWSGCALFTFRGDKVSDLWVLGDLKGLEEQLEHNRTRVRLAR